MLQFKIVLSFLTITALTRAAPCNHTTAEAAAAAAKGAKAIYLITNDIQNAVVALNVNADGTLSKGSMTLTGGQGASGIDGAKNATAGPDALFSQSAIKVDGNVITPFPIPVYTNPDPLASCSSPQTQVLIQSPSSAFPQPPPQPSPLSAPLSPPLATFPTQPLSRPRNPSPASPTPVPKPA